MTICSCYWYKDQHDYFPCMKASLKAFIKAVEDAQKEEDAAEAEAIEMVYEQIQVNMQRGPPIKKVKQLPTKKSNQRTPVPYNRNKRKQSLLGFS